MASAARSCEKASRAARRVADAEVGFVARLGFHHADDSLDERAGREVLARAFLTFAGGLFEQALERRALHVHIHRQPIFLVKHGDDALEFDGIVRARRGLGEDVGEQPAAFAELVEDVGKKVPSGRPTIAQRFIAGMTANQSVQAPQGRKKLCGNACVFFRP